MNTKRPSQPRISRTLLVNCLARFPELLKVFLRQPPHLLKNLVSIGAVSFDRVRITCISSYLNSRSYGAIAQMKRVEFCWIPNVVYEHSQVQFFQHHKNSWRRSVWKGTVKCGADMIFLSNSKRNSESSYVRKQNDFRRVGRVFETHQNH